MATGDISIFKKNAGGTFDESVLAKADIERVLIGAITTHTHNYQPLDADLTSIAAIAETQGLLKKTAAGIWALETLEQSIEKTDLWNLAKFGTTWASKDISGGTLKSIAMSADGKYQTACNTTGFVFKTSDYGVNWTSIDISGGSLTDVAISADGMYQTACNSIGFVFKSSTYGATWTSADVTGGNLKSIAMSADGMYQTACNTTGFVFKTSNYGATWVSVTTGYPDQNHIKMSANGKYQSMAVVTYGRVATSENYGITWRWSNSLNQISGLAMSADGKYLTATSLFGHFYKSKNYGLTWEVDYNGGRGPVAMSADGRYQCTSSDSPSAIIVSSDFGKTWVSTLSGTKTTIAITADGKRMVTVSSGYVYTSVAEVGYGTEEEALGGSEQWNEAYSWGNHALVGYLKSLGGVNELSQLLELYASGTNGCLFLYADDGDTLDAVSNTGTASRGYSVRGTGAVGMSIMGLAGHSTKQGTLTASDANPVHRVKRSTSGPYDQTGDLFEVEDATTASGTVSGGLFCGKINGNIKIYLNPRVDNSASAVAYILDTLNTLSTAGAKIKSIRNNGVEKFALYYDGGIQTPTFKTTPEGGQAIRLINKTGVASVKGTVVSVSDTTDNAFRANPTDGDMPIGVVYEDGIADGSDCWVVISGKAQVLLVNSVATTRSYVAYSSATVAGRIDTSASAPAATQHFREIGHTLESKTAGTNVLVTCIIHFN